MIISRGSMCSAQQALYLVTVGTSSRVHARKIKVGKLSWHSVAQHVFALQRLIQGCQTKQVKFVITFIDFRKAFDSIRWPALNSTLAAYDIPQKLHNAIMALYYGAKAVVTTTDGGADPLPER